MAIRQRIASLYKSAIASETWYPFPGIELGRPGKVATITLGTATGDNGTSGATTVSNKATTTDGKGSGLTVDITAAAGVVTAVAINSGNAGSGYRIGDKITVSAAVAGTGTPVVGYVATLSY
jgi:hypothetical protein